MGLYGDKLTKTDGSGVDVLTKSAGTAQDNLTKSAGTAQDNLAKSDGSAQDNFLHYNSLLSNGNFEGLDLAGLGLGWASAAGVPSIQNGSINGRSQRIAADAASTNNIYQDIIILPNPKNEWLVLQFKVKTNGGAATFTVTEELESNVIYTSAFNALTTTQTITVTFRAENITRLLFQGTGMLEGDYFEIDDVILKALNQDNLTYSI